MMRLVIMILRLYPCAWRERYEEEMIALLEQHTITFWTALDLLKGALGARLDPYYYFYVKGGKAHMNDSERIEKFNERAKKVMRLAQEEARGFQHAALGTEHILLGIVREGEGIAARALKSAGVTPERVCTVIEETKGRGNTIEQGDLPLSAHANEAIEKAMEEANRRHPKTEFPLLGSMYIPEGTASQILQTSELPARMKSVGVKLEQIREAVEEAKERGNKVVRIQIETGMAPFASGEPSDGWHHPLLSINTKDLFFGSLRVPENAAVQILQTLGAPSFEDLWSLVFLEEHATMQAANQGYFQRFSPQARRAWSLAHDEMRHFRNNHIGAEHLLLGLLGEGTGIAATVLAEMGVGLDQVREALESAFGHGDEEITGDINITPQLKDEIEQASDEARRFNQRIITTGHILLVLMRDSEDRGVEAGMLISQGVDLDRLRAGVRHALSEQTNEFGDKAGATVEDSSEEGLYASIASIERDLQDRELDKMLLAAYPFSLNARITLEQARVQARQSNRQAGPEHLLLALTFNAKQPVGKVLKDLRIDYGRTRAAIEKRQVQEAKKGAVVVVQNAALRACLLLAADEAERRGGPGTPIQHEHLLLVLLRDEHGIIADLLGDLGTNVETVRTKLLEAMSSADPQEPGEA